MKKILLLFFILKSTIAFCQNQNLVSENFFPLFDYKINDTLRFSNQIFLGKTTFINYWFKGCRPCIAEIPALNKMNTLLRNNPNFQFISFSIDSTTVISKCVENFKITFPVFHLDKKQAENLNLRSAPTNLIIDKNGVIKSVFTGGATDPNKAYEKIMKEIYPQILTILSSKKN